MKKLFKFDLSILFLLLTFGMASLGVTREFDNSINLSPVEKKLPSINPINTNIDLPKVTESDPEYGACMESCSQADNKCRANAGTANCQDRSVYEPYCNRLSENAYNTCYYCQPRQGVTCSVDDHPNPQNVCRSLAAQERSLCMISSESLYQICTSNLESSTFLCNTSNENCERICLTDSIHRAQSRTIINILN